jgi:hypothetical protein
MTASDLCDWRRILRGDGGARNVSSIFRSVAFGDKRKRIYDSQVQWKDTCSSSLHALPIEILHALRDEAELAGSRVLPKG